MTEQQFQDILYEALYIYMDENNQIENVFTFEEHGILSINKGLVVITDDDSEFQITIV